MSIQTRRGVPKYVPLIRRADWCSGRRLQVEPDSDQRHEFSGRNDCAINGSFYSACHQSKPLPTSSRHALMAFWAVRGNCVGVRHRVHLTKCLFLRPCCRHVRRAQSAQLTQDTPSCCTNRPGKNYVSVIRMMARDLTSLGPSGVRASARTIRSLLASSADYRSPMRKRSHEWSLR